MEKLIVTLVLASLPLTATAQDPYCCSYDLKNCAFNDDHWCEMSWQNCAACSGSWINPIDRTTCIAQYEGCNDVPDSDAGTDNDPCCGQSVCTRINQYWKSCEPPQFCCSWDFATCGGESKWCDQTAANCQGSCGGYFIDPTTRRECTPRWTDCVFQDDCCQGAVCRDKPDDSGWKTCEAPLTPSPTAKPSTRPPTFIPIPTRAPTASPTPAPVVLGTLPLGPYITRASERIVIPNPPVPVISGQKGCPHWDTGILDWHTASSWIGSKVPVAGANVTLPINKRIVIRKPVVGILGVVTIPASSELILGDNATGITLNVRGMDVKGKLTAGSETCRLNNPVTITLYGARPANAVTNVPDKTYKGISVTGSISLHGRRFYRTWTRLAKTVIVGAKVMMLQNQVNWLPGQTIVLVTTAMKDSREWHQNEILTVQAVVQNPKSGVGAAVYVNEAVKYSHVANTGYQAEVGLLSRTIKIQGASTDSEPTDKDPLTCVFDNLSYSVHGDRARPCPDKELTGFGGHVIVHGNGTGFVEGVQLYRMGQTNVLGRYPFHFHLIGNCPTCYFRDSSVHRSFYRCVSIHGTNYVNVKENVAYDVTGFCYYLEDGVEHHNTISFNLAAHIHLLGPEPPTGDGQTTKVYQQSAVLTLPADVTASGFYITNVRNNIIGNAASGGWAGFAFPILPTPLGPHRDLNQRPSNALQLTIDGNTAHSTGWWWYHAPAFYFGGSLYYNNAGVLEYNPGRDSNFNDHDRNTCLRDLCSSGDCGNWCPDWERGWIRMTNSKAFLTTGVGLNSWSGRMEIIGFEAHDVGLGIEALASGFWIDNMLTVCRTGSPLLLPSSVYTSDITGNGFTWYDTGQEHIITNSVFRNCGYRASQYSQYDNSTTRGCGDGASGCASRSYVFAFLTHSDEFNPEVMQATRNITFQKCGRRFSLDTWAASSTVSGRTQNWFDADGSISGLNVPTLIGSGKAEAGLWWTVDNEVVHEPQGPLKFIKQKKQRGLGAFTLFFDADQHSKVGVTVCGNGNGLPCNPLGYIKHMGKKFSSDNGLPVTANADVAGPVGGYSWVLKLNAGSPRNLKIKWIEVRPDTPLLVSIAYPLGTTFSITANSADWCTADSQYSCQETFKPVGSIAAARASLGNTYYVSAAGMLTFRVIQTPKDFVGTPTWILPNYTTMGREGGYALPRFERAGVLLPSMIWEPWLSIVADCPPSSGNAAYCSVLPPVIEVDVCPQNYNQTAYDTCCSSSNCIFADGSS